MKTKLNANSIVAKMKEALKIPSKLPIEVKANPSKMIINERASRERTIERSFRHRDMRQEAMDIGSHGAKEYFGGSPENE